MENIKQIIFVRIVTAVVVLVAIYGCATIVGGTDQQVTFQTEPEGATVKLDGRPLGKTPLSVRLDKKSNQTITFELEGYESLSMPVTTTIEPWFFGNIILGGLIGSTTDAVSGGIIEYAPDQYYVTLVPLEGQILDRSKAKDFIVSGYSHIIEELNSTSSEYLDSLFTLLDIPADKQSEAFRKIKGLSLVYSDIAEFSEKVVGYFEEEKLHDQKAAKAGAIVEDSKLEDASIPNKRIEEPVRWKIPSLQIGDRVDIILKRNMDNDLTLEIASVTDQYIEGIPKYSNKGNPEWYPEKFFYKDIKTLNRKPIETY